MISYDMKVLVALALVVAGIVVCAVLFVPEPEPERFLFPPTCAPVPEQGATICMSWDAIAGEFVEVKRFPFDQR